MRAHVLMLAGGHGVAGARGNRSALVVTGQVKTGLTMNVYTHLQLADTSGAVESLPSLIDGRRKPPAVSTTCAPGFGASSCSQRVAESAAA